ncbi:Blue copper protein [Abeliophyllum distichum]|uniref:Blue copper protein n=1 Tax=Abeliophyllum distichum TaxID=126358 RepID=A0ABD1RZT1_9LAMI
MWVGNIPPNSSFSYVNWALDKTFMVDDILVFNFMTNQHNVLRVPKTSYDECSKDNAIGSAITTGPAKITLDSAGEHYYICTVGNHCQMGQKLAITVSGTPGANPPTSSLPNTPATPSPPPPDSSSTYVLASFLPILLLSIGAALVIYN